MSDLDTLREMFDRADVGYDVDEVAESKDHPTTTQVLTTADGLSTERGSGNLGYSGFFTVFGFDADGKLLWVGAWE